ncbi:MAG TPA: type II secretion system protein [bacterium]|nr:type II secretion system protein [bacterium]HQM52641.1 type II secretion system protein [bacterium]
MRKSGFTLVEIMIVVAIIGLLAAIAIPNFIRAREQTQKNSCLNNLRQFDSAVQQYALEAGLGTGVDVTAALDPYLTNLTTSSACPGGGTYTIGATGTASSCSMHGSVSTFNE